MAGPCMKLGLVPDFELFLDPAKAPQRLVRNRECVPNSLGRQSRNAEEFSNLGLKNRAFRNELGNYLTEIGVEEPRCLDAADRSRQASWPLAFNRWEFEDGGEEPDSICIHTVKTELPVLDESKAGEKLDQLIGQQVLPLGTRGLKKFSVTFQVTQRRAQVQGLAKFVAQVVSRTGGPIGLARGKKVWKSGTQQATITFTKLTKD